MDQDGYFSGGVAETYDRDHGSNDTDLIAETVECLKSLAGAGRLLEFAVGTGRIALPLRAAGCAVSGIELSKAMVAELRKKESGQPMDVAIGDMTSTKVSGPFSLVFLVFNTIDNLVTQEAQIACFKNAAWHMDKGGRFLIETRVPPLQRIPFGETKMAFACSSDHFGIDDYDLVTQRYTSNHVWIRGNQHQQLSIPFRYVWPSELDLMAQLAGLELEHRWSGWDKAPFTHLSERHISVWRKPEK